MIYNPVNESGYDLQVTRGQLEEFIIVTRCPRLFNFPQKVA